MEFLADVYSWDKQYENAEKLYQNLLALEKEPREETIRGTFSPATDEIDLFNYELDESTTAHEMLHLVDDNLGIVRDSEKAEDFNEAWDDVKREAFMRSQLQPKDKEKIDHDLHHVYVRTEYIIKGTQYYWQPPWPQNSTYSLS